MKKRMLAVLLAISISFSLLSGAAFAVEGDEGENSNPTTQVETDPEQEENPAQEPEENEEEEPETDSQEEPENEEEDPAQEPEENEEENPAEEPEENEKEEPAEEPAAETPGAESTEASSKQTEQAEEEVIPGLVTDECVTYIQGKSAGVFDPEGTLSRAEAATIIARLLNTQELGEENTVFSDVSSSSWYAEYVQLLASWGIIQGYDQGGSSAYHPDAEITRAEFVTILCRIMGYSKAASSQSFTDVKKSHWAYTYICIAAEQGWVQGYEDGSFRANNSITRAEAVTIVNRVLGRSASADDTKSLIAEKGVWIFADVYETDWYYDQVMEASIPHECSCESGTEVWTSLTLVSCGLSSGWHTIGNYRFYVNKNHQFQAYAFGLQTVEGSLCYVDSLGRIPLNAAGVYVVSSDKAYYVDDEGKVQSCEPGLQSIGNELYYFNSDGSAALSTTVGYLYFGADGSYTSGNSELDSLVKAALANCVTASMTQSEKLRAAYLYVRDNFRYLSRSHQERGSTDWTEECAIFMFTYSRGNCYCFAAAFMYMARQLGYQAYPISGGIGSTNADHAWVMITWSDGVDYLFDVEIEYAYRYRYSNTRYYNMYKCSKDNCTFTYYYP